MKKSTMNNARRKEILQRYSNRPPFDLKHDDAKNNRKNFKKSFDHIEKSFRTIMNDLEAIQGDDDFIDEADETEYENTENVKKRDPAFRTLEALQKSVPQKQPFALRKNAKKTTKKSTRCNTSKENDRFDLQTIYQNKNINYGKNNPPNHEIIQEDLTQSKKIRNEFMKRKSGSERKINHERIDKTTSTTDIPVEIPKPKPPKKPSFKLKVSEKSKSKLKLSTKKKNCALSVKSTESYASTKQPFLTQDKIISSPSYVESTYTSSFVLDEETPLEKPNNVVKTNNKNNAPSRTKSFLKKGDSKMSYNTGVKSNKSKTKNTNNTSSKNYLGMMNTVKRKMPRLENTPEVTSSDNLYEWLDETPEPKVSFPKETRHAMERLMENSRTPLNKLVKPKDLSIKPAISFNRRSKTIIRNMIDQKADLDVGYKGSSRGIREKFISVVNKEKDLPYERPGSRVIRKIQKPRGCR